LRLHLTLILLTAVAAAQGCASRDPATRAAEQAATESEDDAACREKGAPDSTAYESCRKGVAEERAQQSAIREQKRRDFDRVLGAGTEGQNSY
jgi:type IV pilus biogenesis protein CpaD/CtpE